MQVIIKGPGQRGPTSSDAYMVCNTGAQHAGKAAEMRQQRAAPGRPEARNGLEYGLVIAPGAAPALTGDCKAVGFIPHPLQQVERGTFRRQRTRHRLPRQME